MVKKVVKLGGRLISKKRLKAKKGIMESSLISPEVKYGFEVFRYSYPYGDVDSVNASKLLSKLLDKIDNISNKNKIFLSEELAFFDSSRRILKAKPAFSRKESDSRIRVLRSSAVIAIKSRLNSIRRNIIELILKNNNSSPFFDRIIYVTQLFEKFIDINETNYERAEKRKNFRNIPYEFKRFNEYDKLGVICLAIYEFGIILSENKEGDIDNLIYNFEYFFTPKEISYYSNKLVLASQ